MRVRRKSKYKLSLSENERMALYNALLYFVKQFPDDSDMQRRMLQDLVSVDDE